MQVSMTGQGAYIMQLSATDGSETGLKLYDGWQDQSVSCLTDLSDAGNNLICVGLFDLGSACKTFNSGDLPEAWQETVTELCLQAKSPLTGCLSGC